MLCFLGVLFRIYSIDIVDSTHYNLYPMWVVCQSKMQRSFRAHVAKSEPKQGGQWVRNSVYRPVLLQSPPPTTSEPFSKTMLIDHPPSP